MNELCKERLSYCEKCVLCKKTWDGQIRCDSSKYANEDGTQSSYLPKKDWKRGCNCVMSIACSNPNKHCVLGKW